MEVSEENDSLLPQLVVFDLDYTLWYPEMYQIDGPPFKKNPKTHKVYDCSGEEIQLFPDAHQILHTLQTNPRFNDVQVAVASRTEFKKWAKDCLRLITLQPNSKISMNDVIQYEAIYPKDKQHHFRQIRKDSGIEYENMTFFDNEYYNIRDVQKLGVHCVYCPNGLTLEVWEKGLQEYARKRNT